MITDARKYALRARLEQATDQLRWSTSKIWWLCLLPLAFSYYQVIRILSDYGICWALMEGGWKPRILSWGPPTPFSALKHVFYWWIFEYEPRLTRPLSSLFEIYDTPFRAALWHVIPPHPSLSLTWIFSLILAPLLLFAVLRQLKAGSGTALLAIALYVANPGILSLESFLFRPGKALANAGILLCLWLAARQSAALGDEFERDRAARKSLRLALSHHFFRPVRRRNCAHHISSRRHPVSTSCLSQQENDRFFCICSSRLCCINRDSVSGAYSCGGSTTATD